MKRAWSRRAADAVAALLAAFIGLACLAAVPAAHAQPVVAPNELATLSDAQLCVTGAMGDTLPGPECHWKPVVLPKLWGAPRRGVPTMNDAWFKVAFRLASVPAGGLSMYTTSFHRTGRVFVNGAQLVAIGRMTEPLPTNWNRAQYIELPAAMLHAGLNEIEIQERQYVHQWGGLGALVLGPEATVRPLWEHRVFWQNDLSAVVASITGTIGLVMLCVWLLRRSEATYFWFGWACWLWTIINLDFFVVYPPLPAQAWENFMVIANELRAALMYMFILRYAGRRMPRLEACIWIYVATGSIALITGVMHGSWVSAWFLGPLLATPYFATLLVREGLRRNVWEGIMLGIAAVAECLLSWYDAWLFSGDLATPVFMAHYIAPLYVSVLGMSLIRHFIASLTGFERQHALTLRALEEATQARKDKNLFFSMVSHELKSPLQSIITVLATEDRRNEGRERRDSLKRIQWAVKHMEAQIRDLFVLSVGEDGKLEMRSATFEVGELVDDVVANVSDLAEAKRLAIHVERADDFLFVATDPRRIEQVLLNLLENAVKYTQAGSVTIRYELESGDMLKIAVSDTGVGIPREHIDKLFVPYRRFGHVDREHNSLGIGLAVVQTLLTQLGGRCVVESTPGAGSTFTVRVPVAIAKETAAQPASHDAIHILIVDDRPEMLADLKEVALTLGYQVDTAGSAPLAANQLAVSAYDVVLIDLDMPVKNGYELASEIRRGDGPNSGTCLVAFSAGNRPPGDANASGERSLWPFDSFEQKPVDARAMKRIVETRARHSGA